MDKVKAEQCERFYNSLPNAPRVVNAGFDPVDNVIYIHMPITEQTAFYYKSLLHEYCHARLFCYDIRNIVDVSGDDFIALEELASECGAALLSNILGIYQDNEKNILEYLRYWKNKLSNHLLLQKICPILEHILDREITKQDIPTDVRILMGFF